MNSHEELSKVNASIEALNELDLSNKARILHSYTYSILMNACSALENCEAACEIAEDAMNKAKIDFDTACASRKEAEKALTNATILYDAASSANYDVNPDFPDFPKAKGDSNG